MTYKDLADEIQRYLSSNAWVKGYISEQEIRADRPCHAAIEKTDCGMELSLEKSTAAARFYDIYAGVCGCRIRIGSMENDGTIKKQAVRTRFLDIDKYGNLDAAAAFMCMARDRLTDRLKAQKAEIEGMTHILDELERKKIQTDSLLREINSLIPKEGITVTETKLPAKKAKTL